MGEEPGTSLLTVAEAAQRFGVAESTVWRWLREGRLDSVKVGGGRRIRATAVSAVLNGDRQGHSTLVAQETAQPYEATATEDQDVKHRKLFEDIRALQRSLEKWLANKPDVDYASAEDLVRTIREEETP